MKFRLSGRALVPSLLAAVVGLSVLTFVQAQVVKPVDIKSNKTIRELTSPIYLLTQRVEELEKQSKDLAAKLKKSEEANAKMQDDMTSLKEALKPPKGYTSMYITKLNFERVEGSALMKFFVRY